MCNRSHRVLSVAAAVAAAVAGTGVAPVGAQQRAFLEFTAPRDSYFAGETIQLRVRFGVEQQFLRENMIQLFRQRLDIPVQLELPWLRKLPQRAPSRAPNPAAEHSSIALNNRIVRAARAADRRIGDRQFTVLEIHESYLPTAVGALVLPAPILRFAHATRFEEDFARGRIAVDRRDESIRCDPLSLIIRPLPEVGRPAEFGGAVGRFAVRAVADRTEVAVGEIFKLVLQVDGVGNISTFDTPSLRQLTDFHVYGRLDDRGRGGNESGRRTITYDLAPLHPGISQLPPIRFAYFDPHPEARYHTVRTETIPLVVRPRQAGASRPRLQTPALVPGANDIFDIKSLASFSPATTSPAASTPLYAFLFLVPWLLAFGFRSLLRNRARNRPAESQLRVRQAAAAFHTRAHRADVDLADAIVEFLAAVLGCSRAAVIGPDLRTRLATAGVPEALAGRTTSLLDAVSAPKYHGNAPVQPATDGAGTAPGQQSASPARDAADLIEALASEFDRAARHAR